MDANTITTLIGTLGFPIVAFFVCCYALKYAYDKSLEANKEAFKKLEELTEAINNNTIVLTKLVEKVGEIEVDDNSSTVEVK